MEACTALDSGLVFVLTEETGGTGYARPGEKEHKDQGCLITQICHGLDLKWPSMSHISYLEGG